MSKLGIPVTLTSAVNKPVVETSDIHDVSLNKNQNTINEDTGRAIGDINSLIVGEDNLVGAVNANANAIVNLDDTKANKVDVQTALYLKADKTDLNSYVNDASYDSNTKRINFKHNSTVLAYIDATDFIKDGMVSNVTIENGYLVITFNTDSGQEPIRIPLTDIFNPDNYYTKTAIDTKLGTLEFVVPGSNNVTDAINNAVRNINTAIGDLEEEKADKTAITNLQNTKAAKTTVPNDITRTQTDAIFIHDENGTSTNLFNLRQATTSLAGAMSAADKTKLNNLPITKGTGDQSLINTEGGNVASYKGAVALGKNNGAKQEYAYCFGENNESIGWDSFAVGTGNSIQRHMAMAIGRQNVSRAWGGIAMGLGVETFDNQADDNNNGEIAIGRYNTPAKDKIFTIGCGTSDSDRKNAIEIDVNGKVSFPQENTSITNILQTLNKLVDLTKTITISDGKIPPAYKGNFSTDKFTYTQRGVVLSFPNTSVFKLDQAITNYGKVLVATLYQEITQTTPNYLTITAPNGYKISSVALAMRTFSDSYPIGVAFDTSPTQVYATSETPLYKSFQTPQSSCTLTVVGTDTTGITAYKWLCFTMFEVELVLDV